MTSTAAALAGPVAWAAHVRAVHASAAWGGPCSLDVSPETAQNFSGFSSLAAAEKELRACLPPRAASRVVHECQAKAAAAFVVRREAVSFKKVMLKVQQDAAALDAELVRLSLYFYVPNVSLADADQAGASDNADARAADARAAGATDASGAACATNTCTATLPNSDMKEAVADHLEASRALMHCRSALVVATDARVFSKRVCALPRFPGVRRERQRTRQRSEMEALPLSLGAWKLARKSRCAAPDTTLTPMPPQQQQQQQQQERDGDGDREATAGGDGASSKDADDGNEVNGEDASGFLALVRYIREAGGATTEASENKGEDTGGDLPQDPCSRTLLHLEPYGAAVLGIQASTVQLPLSMLDSRLVDSMLFSIEPAQLRAAAAPWPSAAGMAAPQWGHSLRIFIWRREYLQKSSHPQLAQSLPGSPCFATAINPKYAALPRGADAECIGDGLGGTGEAEADGVEGCFSVPGMRGTVRRPHRISASFSDRSGALYTIELCGWAARVFQHECDHTEGRLYDDAAAGRCSNKAEFVIAQDGADNSTPSEEGKPVEDDGEGGAGGSDTDDAEEEQQLRVLALPWVGDFVEAVLIARGVAKAMAVAHELRRLGQVRAGEDYT